jgi:ketosteroid isomerase-like protein
VLLSEIPALPVDHPLRAALDERYFQMRLAMAARDANALRAVLARDFVSEDIEGRCRDAAAMIESVMQLEIDRSKRAAETTLTAIDRVGDEALVDQRYAMTTSEVNPSLPQALWTRSRDIWRWSDERWLLARTTTIAIEVVKNGRRIYRHRPDPIDTGTVVELSGPAR